jgi:hypothetical protein
MTELQELEQGGLMNGQTPVAAPAEPVVVSEGPVPGDQPETLIPDEAKGPNRYAAAGRIGAQRVHQLIREGKLYEREHGLKPGRQRLRQLIQLGKMYEREHGLNGSGTGTRRPVRMSSEKALVMLFESLLRLVKPGVRQQLLRVLQSLEGEQTGQN